MLWPNKIKEKNIKVGLAAVLCQAQRLKKILMWMNLIVQ